MAPEPADESPEARFIVLGSARLPKSLGGDQSGALMIELSLDSADGRIADVATTVTLPGYTALLRSLLVGRRLDEVEGALEQLSARLRGPLLKPTIAALAKAASSSEKGGTAGGPGNVS